MLKIVKSEKDIKYSAVSQETGLSHITLLFVTFAPQ